MPNVAVTDRRAQLDLDGEDAPIFPFDDQIDLVLSTCRSQMAHPRLGCLRIHAHVDGDERLEERTEKRAVARNRRPDRRFSRLQQRAGADAEQAGRERGVDELMLGRRREPAQAVPKLDHLDAIY
jgi:hypothetical protein